MNSKKFTLFFTLTLFTFVLINALIWNLYTKTLLVKTDNFLTGDLTRMGYLNSLVHPRKNKITLEKTHFRTPNYNFEKIDMITLGDSFSNGGAGGLNRYYQDYISTILNINILNIEKFNNLNEIDTLATLVNSGFLNTIGVKYVLCESTQRKVIERLTSNINFNSNEIKKNILNFYDFGKTKKNISSLKIPQTSFINNGNFKFLLYNLLYNFSDYAFISKVYIADINENLFSIKPYNKLLFYRHDLRSIEKNNKHNIELSNSNLNKLAKLLKKQNIKLIFMPVVSKYDLYSDYITNNKYPTDPFFKYFREVEKDYIFVDTKAILKDELKKGEKDIFYTDDTHWSYKASEAIANHLKSLLQPDK